jgi:hypothetical protein
MLEANYQPDLRPIGKRKYQLWQNWSYTWVKDDIIRRIKIPAGFISDGASVPRFLWTITGITPDGELRSAALIHDYLYGFGGNLPDGSYQKLDSSNSCSLKWIDLDDIWTRKNADRIFARIMRECGVSMLKRRMAYRGVRTFGWMFFKKKK